MFIGMDLKFVPTELNEILIHEANASGIIMYHNRLGAHIQADKGIL
jgi:hypothetical protein